MRVHLVNDDGTVLFIGAVDPDDPEQFITWKSTLGKPSHLRVNVTSIGSQRPRLPIEPIVGPDEPYAGHDRSALVALALKPGSART